MRHESCDRARRWISISLDEGLAELEERLLGAHLGACAACRAFEKRATVATHALRSAELLPLARQITLPAPRRLIGLRVASASAAAAVVLAVVGGLALATSSDQVGPTVLRQAANVQNTEVLDAREARRKAMVPQQNGPLFSHVQMARGDRI